MPPKRKTPDNGIEKPSKKPKPSKTMGNGNSNTEKDATESEWKNKRLYELISGDLDSVKLGVKDASKLQIQFKEIKTGKVAICTYKTPENEIGWKNKLDMERLQKWRRKVILDHGFPPERETTSWQPQEEAFLELLFRLLQQLIDNGETLRRPTNKEIKDHFNKFFATRRIPDKKGNLLPPRPERQVDSIGSKLKRSPLGDLVTATRNKCTGDQSSKLHLPDIAREKLHQFTSSRTFPLSSTSGGAGQSASEGHALPKKSTTQDKDLQTAENKAQEIVLNAVSEQSQSTTSEGGRQTTAASIEHFTRPAETGVTVTPSDEIKRMIEDGWSIPFVSDDTAVADTIGEDSDKLELKDTWMKQAVDGFHDRLKRVDFGYGGEKSLGSRYRWYRDWTEETINKRGPEEKYLPPEEESLEQRVLDAQNVNAVLAFVPCPPIGYGGDINALTKDRALPKFELALAKESERTLMEHMEKFDAECDRRKKLEAVATDKPKPTGKSTSTAKSKKTRKG